MSIFNTITEILDPFNIMGFNEKPETEPPKPVSYVDSYKENGIYPWDDDDDDD